jgi:hypothetical protein
MCPQACAVNLQTKHYLRSERKQWAHRRHTNQNNTPHANNRHVAQTANLFTVCTGTVSGIPARNIAMRHSLARCEEGPRTLPMTTSPMSAAATPVFANVALNNVASMSSAGVLERPPRRACIKLHYCGTSRQCGGLFSCLMAKSWYDGTRRHAEALFQHHHKLPQVHTV